MEWNVVPMSARDMDYFDRQRDLFSRWLGAFDEDWRSMRFDDSLQRFDKELDRVRRDLLRMDVPHTDVKVHQPFITDAVGNRKLSLKFDCSQFKPEEITVKTQDNVLCVHAKHEEDTPGKKMHIEFTKNYTIPKNVDPKLLKSTLSADGVLQIEAPAPPAVEAPKEHLVPIEHL